MRASRFVLVLLALLMLVPVAAHAGPADAAEPDPCAPGADRHEHAGSDDAAVRVVVVTLCERQEAQAGGAAVGDCTSEAYAVGRHAWTRPYAPTVDAGGSGLDAGAAVDAVDAAGRTWDATTLAAVFDGARAGGNGAAVGTRDGVNQIGWRDLGATGVVGRATTWMDGSGRAIEADVAFNSQVPWSTTGRSDAMDLQSVATHELGHVLGLDHPADDPANACLTMFHATARGSLAARTLAPGDRLGIQSVYGAPEVTPQPFEATFHPKPGNAWWIEVNVDANRPLAGVTARVGGGTPIELTLRSWGSWATSVHVPAGSIVQFEAHAEDGAAAEAPTAYVWPTAEPAGDAPFEATFHPKSGNAWWVEVDVDANRPLAGVTAQVGDGHPVALEPTSWGTWAKSFHVPDGSAVTFTAHAQDGGTATSPTAYEWPSAEPVTAPLDATFRKGGANEWWVEVKVDADAPLASVTARIDGGAPVALAPTDWGTWAKSTRVPEGATLRFTAEAEDGRRATSEPFAWP